MFEGLEGGALVATFGVIILREVLSYFREKNAASQFDGMKKKIYEIDNRVEDLHEWHAKEDDEGRKVWYSKKSLETSMERLASNADKQNLIFHRVVDKFESYDAALAALKSERNN